MITPPRGAPAPDCPHTSALELAPALAAALLLALAACGDDSGNNNNHNQVAICGDGVVADVEQCDDGTANSDLRPDACRTDCTLARCGDGVTDVGELCDEGPWNSDQLDAPCRLDCGLPTCGDGVLDAGEQCDDGAANSNCEPDACRTNCVRPRCGDGVVDPGAGEVCDGGATECVDCRLPCQDCDGDRFGEGAGCLGPDCDDQNPLAFDECGSTCTPETCPTGCCFTGICVPFPRQNRDFCGVGGAECEPCGADTYCTGGACVTAQCGDGKADPGEECDGADLRGRTCLSLGTFSGGNLACDTAACTYDVSGCTGSLTCGNGVVDDGEACDDGVNDGTYGTCLPGCLARAPYCGNGTRDATEPCEGTDLGGATCDSVGLPGGGTLSCSDCQLDTSGCCQDEAASGDGDGYGEHCDLGPDACEGDAQNWTAAGCAGCTDQDGDGHRGTGCDAPDDACEGDALNWTAAGCTDCTDTDGDGHRGTDCDAPDDACEDDLRNWTVNGCTGCTDADHDGDRGTDCDDPEDCDDDAPGITGPCTAEGCPAGFIRIPAGVFQMGCNDGELGNTCLTDEQPRHPVTLSGYCLQATETSVAEFRACQQAGQCFGTPTVSSTDTWCNWTASAAGIEDHPLNCINWYESREFCQAWLGGDLPTEAEWEKGARGGDPDTRTYPWGDTPPPDCTECNFDVNDNQPGEGCAEVQSGPGTWAVGSLPAGDGDSPYGLRDMAGNVYEWTLDHYDANFYGLCASGCTDPVNQVVTDTDRVRRGSSYANNTLESLRVVYRNYSPPDERNHWTGLRCRWP